MESQTQRQNTAASGSSVPTASLGRFMLGSYGFGALGSSRRRRTRETGRGWAEPAGEHADEGEQQRREQVLEPFRDIAEVLDEPDLPVRRGDLRVLARW